MAVVEGGAILSGGGTATLTPLVGYSAEQEYFTSENDAQLSGTTTYRGSADLSATTYAGIVLEGGESQFTETNPFVIAGTGGNVNVPAAGVWSTPVGDKWLQYQAPFAGSMIMSVTDPATGLPITYHVYDSDGDELQSDSDGELGLVLFGADLVKIKLEDTEGVWVQPDLADTFFYGSSSGTLYGQLNDDGHIVSNEGNWPDFSFPNTPLLIDGTSTYEFEFTFTAASAAGEAAYAYIYGTPGYTQADYEDSTFRNFGWGSPSGDQTTFTVTTGPGMGQYDTAIAAGQAYVFFEIDQNAELVSLRWRKVSDNLDNGFTLTWTYAARASSRLICAPERPDVLETPGAISLNISNGYPNDSVVFSVIGPTTVLDFQVATLDWAGLLEDYAIMLPALQPGNYVLHCEAVGSGAEDVDFRVINPALTFSVLDVSDPTPPAVTVQRWTFYDVRNASSNWTLQRNPKAWTNMHPPNDFTHENTTAPDGQILTWEAGSRPWRMEFTGYIDDQSEYERFVFWSEKRRRLWLIDHRNRAWLVTLEHFDAQARIEPNKPWAHDYTVRALIFKQGTD